MYIIKEKLEVAVTRLNDGRPRMRVTHYGRAKLTPRSYERKSKSKKHCHRVILHGRILRLKGPASLGRTARCPERSEVSEPRLQPPISLVRNSNRQLQGGVTDSMEDSVVTLLPEAPCHEDDEGVEALARHNGSCEREWSHHSR